MGINAGDGFIRQFVAVPLRVGRHRGRTGDWPRDPRRVQLRAVGLTEQALEAWRAAQRADESGICCDMAPMPCPEATGSADMGLGAGGRMRQRFTPMTVRSPITTRAARGGFSSICVRPRSGRPSPERYRPGVRSTAAPTSAPVCLGSTTMTPMPRTWRLRRSWRRSRQSARSFGGEDVSFVPVDPKTVISLGDQLKNTVTDGNW